MPDIQVQHVIFTRVERAYSPRNSSGYQVVYHSRELGKEVEQIEKRLQCFETGKGKSERHQFFWTEKGQAVLAKSVSLLQSNPEVIDRSQRDAFLAHALVVSKEAFARVWNDPFAVFEAAEEAGLFAVDDEQLVGYLREKAPVERLTAPRRKRVDVASLLEGWQSEELLKLFRLGLQASALSKQGQSLLLFAEEEEEEIYLLLSLMLMLIPPDYRGACTFDTYVDGCYPAAGAFWAMGSSKGKSYPGSLPIRLIERRLEIKGGNDGFLDPKALMSAAHSTEGYVGCCAQINRGA
jgi:hypothetical protein